MGFMRLIIVISVCLMSPWFGLVVADEVWLNPHALSVTASLSIEDNQFAWYGGPSNPQEWLRNFGGASRTRIKGYQDVTALKFDLSAFKGRSVKAAELHLARADAIAVFALVVSTINTDWHEGTQGGNDARPGESCWRWRSRPTDDLFPGPEDEWTFSHSDFSTAAFGNFGSLVCYAYKAKETFDTYTSNGHTWIRMKLDPDVVHALIVDQFGLAVTDPRGYGHNNPRIYTKDQNQALSPRLLIEFNDARDIQPPDTVDSLTAEAGPNDSEIIVSFQAPNDPDAEKALGYNIWISDTDDILSAKAIERWRIPRPAPPGTTQRVLIEGLNPGDLHYCFIQAYDAAGNGSPVTKTQCQLPPPQREPEFLDAGFDMPGPETLSVREVPGVLRYWVCPETTKVNPKTGNRLEDGYEGTGSNDYKKSNAIWNSEGNTISLTASRNEMVGFQLVLERLGARLSNITVAFEDCIGPSGSEILADMSIETFRVHYVSDEGQMFPDAAIPLDAPFPKQFNIPDDAHNPEGVNQTVWVDVYIPREVTSGLYEGHVSVSADELGQPIVMPFRIQVSSVQIPDVSSFVIDMNGYGNPWAYGNQGLTRLRWFQIFHKHRVSLNTLPYGWNATVREDRAPALSGNGEAVYVSDWAQFDQAYGPMFDGTAFSPIRSDSAYYGPGMNIPVSTFYTPFFESWPIHVLDPQHGFDATGQGGDYWNNLIDADPGAFWTDAPDVMDAFTHEYKQGVRNVVKAWMEHAEQKGWLQTHFQIYLNHKYSYRNCDALWILEECTTADDFRAVRFFHELYRQGAELANAPHVKWHRRIDISDKWGQHYGQLDNCINWVVINGGSSDWYWPSLRYRNVLNAQPEQWAWYGSGPAPQDPGIKHAQRILQAWAQGLDGGLPYWDNFQTSWNEAEALSTVYSGKNVPGFGMYDGPIMSIRVKMMRQAQQIVELLNLLAQQQGWSRERVTRTLVQTYGDGHWQRSFTTLTQDRLYHLRGAIMATLERYLIE